MSYYKINGRDGRDGLNGNCGDKGDKGCKGDIGCIGEKGNKGDIGLTGIIGLTGPIGLNGLKGEKGMKGELGISNFYSPLLFGGIIQTSDYREFWLRPYGHGFNLLPIWNNASIQNIAPIINIPFKCNTVLSHLTWGINGTNVPDNCIEFIDIYYHNDNYPNLNNIYNYKVKNILSNQGCDDIDEIDVCCAGNLSVKITFKENVINNIIEGNISINILLKVNNY